MLQKVYVDGGDWSMLNKTAQGFLPCECPFNITYHVHFYIIYTLIISLTPIHYKTLKSQALVCLSISNEQKLSRRRLNGRMGALISDSRRAVKKPPFSTSNLLTTIH